MVSSKSFSWATFFVWELMWIIDFWVISSWNKFGEKALVVFFAELVWTDLLAVWTEQHSLYTWYLPRPDRKELNLPKLKSSHELTVLIYILCKQVGGWLDVFQPPIYKSDGKAFLQILPRKHNENGLSYPHIQLKDDSGVKWII